MRLPPVRTMLVIGGLVQTTYGAACVLAMLTATPAPAGCVPVQPKGPAYLAFLRTGPEQEKSSQGLWACNLSTKQQFRISGSDESVVGKAVYSSVSGVLAWWSVNEPRGAVPVHSLRVWHSSDEEPATIYRDAEIDPDALSISPDGLYLVFGRSRGEFGNGPIRDWGIWQIRTDGTGLRRLTDGFGGRGRSLRPTISPDGKLIAFYGYLFEEVGSLCLVGRNGGVPEILPLEIRDVAWYPSSKRLIVAQAGPDNEPWDSRLASYDIATGCLRALTSYRRAYGDHTPVFSADGKKLAYFTSHSQGGTSADCLSVLDLETELTHTIVADADLFSSECVWAADSVSLFYVIRLFSEEGVDFQVWSARADGASKQKVLDHARSPVLIAR
ncbi:MAG: PD40 domain-containing protein [Armatimonadota bacterium]|nr:MAG: PD40 domain-containing protein [Armatimonadota bacterium]